MCVRQHAAGDQSSEYIWCACRNEYDIYEYRCEDNHRPGNETSSRRSRSPSGRSGWVNIGNATSADYTPALEDVRSYFRATTSYSDGQGPGKTAHGVSPCSVDAPPPVNPAPAFPSTENGQRDVPEDAAASAAIGAPVAATDFDMDDLSYPLGGTDSSSQLGGDNK